MKRNIHSNARNAGVTLLEMMTVLVVVGILITLTMPAVSSIISQMERARCTGNLRALYTAAALYVQDHRQWPQIDTTPIGSSTDNSYDLAWIAALKPYRISEKGWLCPTVEKIFTLSETKKEGEKRKERIDYFATPFDDKEVTPYRWPGQPWFIERGAVHGNGNLVIFTDGSVKGMNEMMYKKKKK